MPGDERPQVAPTAVALAAVLRAGDLDPAAAAIGALKNATDLDEALSVFLVAAHAEVQHLLNE